MKHSLQQQFSSSGSARVAQLCITTAVALIGILPSTFGQLIYQTGFEPPTFVAGTPLVGQDGWVAPPPLSPNAAVVTGDKPRLGRQTVHVLGADLEHQDFINDLTGGYYDAIGSYRRPVNFDTGGTKTVCVSARVRIDGPRTQEGDNFFSAALSTRAETTEGTASVGEMALSSDGHVYVYSGNDSVPTFLANARIRVGQWCELTIVADFSTRMSSFYLDGRCLGAFPFDASETYTGLFLRGTLLAYTAPDTATNHKADYAAHFDQFAIAALQAGDGCDDGDSDHLDR
jgi:hypothetical protein